MSTAVKRQEKREMAELMAMARPRFFLKVAAAVLPLSLLLMVLLFCLGLHGALVTSPPDYQQGELVRILYVHVPASWMGLMIYGFVALMSAIFLVWRHPMAEVLAISAAPVGALFTFLSLVTGSLWGGPTWGTFWVWDARLTSMLALLLLYGGYWMLHRGLGSERGIRLASFVALLGLINLPIIKGSVTWWNTLHQPASFMKMGPSALHEEMLIPLLLMAGAYFFYFLSVFLMRAQCELRARKQGARGA